MLPDNIPGNSFTLFYKYPVGMDAMMYKELLAFSVIESTGNPRSHLKRVGKFMLQAPPTRWLILLRMRIEFNMACWQLPVAWSREACWDRRVVSLTPISLISSLLLESISPMSGVPTSPLTCYIIASSGIPQGAHLTLRLP